MPEYQPRIPYSPIVRKDQQDEQFKKLLDMLKTFHITVPFVEALAQMPHYAKFLKELLTNKRKLEEVSMVTLSEGVRWSSPINPQSRKKIWEALLFLVPLGK